MTIAALATDTSASRFRCDVTSYDGHLWKSGVNRGVERGFNTPMRVFARGSQASSGKKRLGHIADCFVLLDNDAPASAMYG